MLSPVIKQLIDALCYLPGIGPKSAQRIAFYLLQHPKERVKAKQITTALHNATIRVQHCQRCRTLCESDQCPLCRNPKRQQHLLCVVETPIDMLTLEQTGSYQGCYFVLMGRLSPLDGIGPDEIGLDKLFTRLTNEPIEELILATNATTEGNTTAHYIIEKCRPLNIRCTRIARGVPLGGELEYLDTRTLTQALHDRTCISE